LQARCLILCIISGLTDCDHQIVCYELTTISKAQISLARALPP